MATYFDLTLQFQRTDLYPNLVQDLHAALAESGMVFQSSCRDEDPMTEQEIILWNQKKLNGNFELGYTQHVRHDYKQNLFSFHNYSEVRAYWINYPRKGFFNYSIIIPESEVLSDKEGGIYFRQESLHVLAQFAAQIWSFPPIQNIQTGLELSGPNVSLMALRAGIPPIADLLAVLKKSDAVHIDLNPYKQFSLPAKDGIMLIPKMQLH